MTKRKTHPRIGSDFEDFLRDEGRLEEAAAVAIKRVLAWEIQRAMDSAGVSQTEMARRMKTSLAAYRRGELKAIPLQEVLAKYRAPCSIS